jgi:hypothetical protein
VQHTEAADAFCFSLLVYHLLSGRPVFADQDTQAVLAGLAVENTLALVRVLCLCPLLLGDGLMVFSYAQEGRLGATMETGLYRPSVEALMAAAGPSLLFVQRIASIMEARSLLRSRVCVSRSIAVLGSRRAVAAALPPDPRAA